MCVLIDIFLLLLLIQALQNSLFLKHSFAIA